MTTDNPVSTSSQKKNPLQLIILAGAALIVFGGSVAMMLLLFSLTLTPNNSDLSLNYQILTTAGLLFGTGLLILPALVNQLLHLSGRAPRRLPAFFQQPMQLANLLLVFWLGLMISAWFLSQNDAAAWWALPILQVPAMAIPLFWIFQVATRNWRPRKARRNWNLLGINLSLLPITVILFEIGLLAIMFGFGMLWLFNHPDLMQQLNADINQISAANFNEETLLRIAEPYLTNPMLIFLALLMIAGFVPVIEELLKPFLVWRWAKHPLSPADGFVIGILGGLAFALWENLSALGSIAASEWTFVVIARYGTSILHMATAGVMGWAWMSTWQDRNYWRVGVSFFVVLVIHGTWNLFTLLETFAQTGFDMPEFVLRLAPATPYVLASLLALSLVILLSGCQFVYNQSRKIQTGLNK
ncbi:MAG: PrsW family intramembrane metalloprotease [Anaerolineaceae bacterium]|nr:PrsW family intramembrane metalloprotease [Anaerolineaceae bacterium]